MIVLALLGCGTAVHVAAPGGFGPYAPITAGEIVTMTVTRQSKILGVDKDTNYVDEAWDGFLARCPNGQLTAVTAQHTTRLGFLQWHDRITLRGLCISE